MNEAFQAAVVGEIWRGSVEVPLSQKPVKYVLLDELLLKYQTEKGVRMALPIEDVEKLPPRCRKH